MNTRSLCRLTIVIGLIVFQNTVSAQQKTAIPVLTADSLATGNSKDVLSSFFQLAFNNLTGPNKGIRFASNPYAIMLRANPDLAIDTSYVKYRALRNLNFNFDLKMDTNYKFNGFSSGITFAVINKRDETVYDEFNTLVRLRTKDYDTLTDRIAEAVSALILTDPAFANQLMSQGNSLLNDPTFTSSQLAPRVKDTLLTISKANDLQGIYKLLNSAKPVNIYNSMRSEYEAVKNSFHKRPLWIVGVTDTTYSDQLLFSNITFRTQYLQGVWDVTKASHLEMDVKGELNLVKDTLKAGRNLKRSLLNAEAGVNWVYKERESMKPLFELKFSAAYSRIFSGIYSDEIKERFTLNGTFRVRIINDLWIPLQFKYDPKTGNVFGFLSVKFNFSGLSNLVNINK